MATNRIHERLQADRSASRGSLLPYLTAGFPDVGATGTLIRRADALGAAAIEIGMPYSDSLADGPVIQASFNEALAGGHRVEDAMRLIADVRPSVACGLIAMVSYSIVFRLGLDAFMARAAEAGCDGVILPDVPVEEAGPTASAAESAGLCHIGLVAPTTSPDRRRAIVEATTGFVYQIAVAGTTGARATLSADLSNQVATVRAVKDIPVCVGFGISTPEQVRSVCSVADGAIVGSAIMGRIASVLHGGGSRDQAVDAAGDFVAELMTGLVG